MALATAESSLCPHCGRTTKTVQGVCADCWGSKVGRQFWLRKHAPRRSTLGDLLGVDLFHPLVLAAAAASIGLGVLLWIST